MSYFRQRITRADTLHKSLASPHATISSPSFQILSISADFKITKARSHLERSGRKLCMWTIVRLGRPQRNRTDSLRKKYGMCIFLHKNLWNFKMQLLLDKCNRRLDIYAMAVMFGFQEFMCEVADFCEVRRFVCEFRRFL